MKQIRKNVFETNSSSCHSLVISKDDYGLNNIPTYLNFDAEEDYGWEQRCLDTKEEKASYLYTAMLNCDTAMLNCELWAQAEEFKRKLSEDFGIKIGVPEYRNFRDYNGSVDHAGELVPFIDEVLENDDKLKRFLFDTKSKIYTGNDNENYGESPCYVADTNEDGKYFDWEANEFRKHPLYDSARYEYYFKGN